MVEQLEKIGSLSRRARPERQGDLRVRRQVPNAGRGAWTPLLQPVGRPFPDPPPGWQDGLAAWAIYASHARLGRGPEGGLWFYRAQFAGHIGVLGFSVDFIEADVDVLVEVFGHTDRETGDPRAVIALRTIIARRFGQTYIVIDDEDALTAPTAALRLALAGVSRSQYQ